MKKIDRKKERKSVYIGLKNKGFGARIVYFEFSLKGQHGLKCS